MVLNHALRHEQDIKKILALSAQLSTGPHYPRSFLPPRNWSCCPELEQQKYFSPRA